MKTSRPLLTPPILRSNTYDAFQDLVARLRPGAIVSVDGEAVRRRLELIRNLVLLQEREDIDAHVRKLRPAATQLKLESILSALDAGDFTRALERIEAYLQQATALVQAGVVEIPRLKLQLRSLELRLEAVSDEKAELERRLVLFNRRHDEALGDMIQRVLHAKATLARLRADLAAEEEDEADVAEARYQRVHRAARIPPGSPAAPRAGRGRGARTEAALPQGLQPLPPGQGGRCPQGPGDRGLPGAPGGLSSQRR